MLCAKIVGLCPGSSSQEKQSGAWIQPGFSRGEAATIAPPRLVRGVGRRRPRRAPLEAPSRRHDFTRFVRLSPHVWMGFRCIVRRFSGTYVNGQYLGILAPLSARRDVLPE